jgi:hypothetical protein
MLALSLLLMIGMTLIADGFGFISKGAIFMRRCFLPRWSRRSTPLRGAKSGG